MSYADLKIMTRGGSDTDLEPSEEFPILFGLLTAPMNNSSTGTAGSGSKSSSSSYLSKYFRKSSEVSQNEPDSSAFSDDGMCISEEDEDDYTSYSDSDDDDDDLGEDGNRNDESVVSSNSGDECCPVIVTAGKSSAARQDEIDRLPSSTTVDDEDYDDILFASHTQGVLSSSRPNNHSCKALKRSYHQMSCARPVQESRSIARVVVAGGAARKEDGGDTEDEEVKSYCFGHDGLENFKREIQLNRLAPSPTSGSSPEHLQRKATEDLALHHLRPPPLPQSQISDPQIVQPLKRQRTDSDRTGSSSLNHEQANITGAYNDFNTRRPEKSKSEMYVGFSFAIEKMRPTTQKVAQLNPVIDSIESFSNVVTDNSTTNALSFNINNDSSNNNNAHSTIPLLLPNQVQKEHPTDNNYANKLAPKIILPFPKQTTANNESNTKYYENNLRSQDSSANNQQVRQSKTEKDCALPEGNADANLENLESYKCVHCDLILEERHMLASHCCRNLHTQKR